LAAIFEVNSSILRL